MQASKFVFWTTSGRGVPGLRAGRAFLKSGNHSGVIHWNSNEVRGSPSETIVSYGLEQQSCVTAQASHAQNRVSPHLKDGPLKISKLFIELNLGCSS
jgi:hypothetical protein